MEPELAQIDKVFGRWKQFIRWWETDLSQRYPKTQQNRSQVNPCGGRLADIGGQASVQFELWEDRKGSQGQFGIAAFFAVCTLKMCLMTRPLIRWANQIKPETLKALHNRVVQIAEELKSNERA